MRNCVAPGSVARLYCTVSILAMLGTSPALAQTAPQQEPATELETIVVTAQRQAESLQDVPIPVSVFSAEQLERQQIDNTLDIQLSLPNVTFTKSNFTSSNLSIRGIGEALVATSSDSGVGIHYNDMPINSPRLFEGEFFDLERIEVLRGPQGTQFGRNATGGVMNVISRKPTREFAGKLDVEYGNFESLKVSGALNVPVSENLALRVAGYYLNRDGFTRNIFNSSTIDGRDQYALRGSLRWTPTDRTTVDVMVQHFKEDSDRSRNQKQLCLRDPSAILGCRPDGLGFEALNANTTLAGVITSREFLSIAFAPNFIPGTAGAVAQQLIAAGVPPLQAQAQAFGTAQALFAGLPLNSVYGPDQFSGIVNPADLRTVNLDYNPTYRSDETVVMLTLNHDFDNFSVKLNGGYQESGVTSRTDYNQLASRPYSLTGNTLRQVFPAAAGRFFQGSNVAVSSPDRTYTGFIGGKVDRFAAVPTEFDESNGTSEQYSIEAIVSSKFDGPINFLLGGLYYHVKGGSDFFVAASGLDYGSAILGAGQGLASPFFNNEVDDYTLKSTAIFGEAYWQINDTLKLTLGARYTIDDKSVTDVFPQPLLGLGPVPFGTESARNRVQFREIDQKFKRLTGRVVLDWKPELSFTDDTLIYASYSRGYKGGGVNPAFDPRLFVAPTTFAPETINAFEIGTKNRFLDDRLQANLTAFYYDYKGLQVSRIINRTSFNDNTDAEVYGLEGEFLFQATPNWLFNASASYLHTSIKGLQLTDTRDPSNGRNDTVIIKDITNASNCVVTPTATLPPGSAAGLVNQFNAGLNAQLAPLFPAGSPGVLQGVTPVPGTNTVGAFSVCQQLAATIASQGLPFAITLPPGATRTAAGGGFIPITNAAILAGVGLPDGIAADLSGNELQNSPNWKFSVGAQYSHEFESGIALTARIDYSFTGSYFGRNFNKPIDKISSYDVINLQAQVTGPNDRWFIRAFVQNLENDDSVVGLYVTDPSSGLFTNVFTLEPRRYGLAFGVSF
jgi:outer membrane receptor protein involved in Fe transport